MKKIIVSLILAVLIIIVPGVIFSDCAEATSSNVNVTVPATTNVVFNSDGSNTISDFKIANSSLVPIKVTDVTPTALNGWQLVSDASKLTKDTKKLKLTLADKVIVAGTNTLNINITEGSNYTLPIKIDRGAWTTTVKESAFRLVFNYTLGKKHFNLSFTTNGGSAVSTQSVYNGDTVTLPSTTKTGYTLTGWADSSGVIYKPGTNYTMPIGDTALTAQWSANTYTYNIKYKSSTGKLLGTTAISGTFGSSKSVSAPTKVGYTTPSTQTVKFDSTSAKTITFTYPIINYKITYNLAGGTASGNPTRYNIESSTITLKTPTKPGYNFKGWTGSNGTTPQATVTIPSSSIGDKTYTATWTLANNIKVTFRHNLMNEDYSENYTVKETSTTTGTANASITLANYKKTYKGFTYVNAKVNGSVQTTTTILADGSRVVDLYYKREKAYLLSGSQVNGALNSLSPENKLIVTGTAIPENKIATAKLISTSNSPVKVYAYKDISEGKTNTYISAEADGISIVTGSDCSSMFSCVGSVTYIDASRLDTSNATSMNNMFADNYNITEIRINGPKFNTRNVTSMSSMFINNPILVTLDHNIDTTNVIDVSTMFYSCYAIKSHIVIRNPNMMSTYSMVSETATNSGAVFDLYFTPETEAVTTRIYRDCVAYGNVNLKPYKG